MPSVVAAWKVGLDGKLFRYAWQVWCPDCGYLGPKMKYRTAVAWRAEHECDNA